MTCQFTSGGDDVPIKTCGNDVPIKTCGDDVQIKKKWRKRMSKLLKSCLTMILFWGEGGLEIKYMLKVANKNEEPFVFGEGKEEDVVEKLTFGKFEGAALPRPDEVSYIFKHLKLIEDF